MIKELISEKEKSFLHPSATGSYDELATKRDISEEDSSWRTPFQIDRDRIIHSKAFRRLMHKTQVFIRPDSEHLRNRMTHTMEVMQIARTIARAIGANEDLTEAIALGHDLGHTPFGHTGEEVIKEKLSKYGFKFAHYIQSWRIVAYLERYFRFQEGLNLTKAVEFGILRHSGKYNNGEESVEVWDKEGKKITIEFPQTLEEKIVRIADDIAWINHDWDDGIRSGLLTDSLLGANLIRNLGTHQAIRIIKMINDVINYFRNHGEIRFSPKMEELKNNLVEKIRRYLWDNEVIILYNEEAKRIIEEVFDYFMLHPEKLPKETRERRNLMESSLEPKKALVIADYISGMTDDWLFKNFETYLYSHFSRFKELQIKKSYNWIISLEIGENKGQVIRIEKPEDLKLEVGSKLKVFSMKVENGEEILHEEKGTVISQVGDQVKIEALSNEIRQGDILVIED